METVGWLYWEQDVHCNKFWRIVKKKKNVRDNPTFIGMCSSKTKIQLTKTRDGLFFLIPSIDILQVATWGPTLFWAITDKPPT